MSTVVPIVVIVIAALLAFTAGALVARRKGYAKLGEVVARCRRGHLFTTDWSAPGRRIDLGWARIQHCPVGDHLTIVRPVDESQLTPQEKQLARKNRDAPASAPAGGLRAVSSSAVAIVIIVIILLALVATTLVARRRGYNVPGEIVVRCLQGHLFMTIWIPGGSLKAIRFGWIRLQRCPVGDHVTFVTPVRESELTDEERRAAHRYHDTPVP